MESKCEFYCSILSQQNLTNFLDDKVKLHLMSVYSQSLFGKEADKLEHANDDEKTCILFADGHLYVKIYACICSQMYLNLNL